MTRFRRIIMIKQMIFSWLAIAAGCFAAEPSLISSQETSEQHASLASWRKVIEESKELPKDQAIEQLGRCVVKMTKRHIFQVNERWEVYRSAQAELLSIPGHAEYFRDKIDTARERMETALKNGNEGTYFPARIELRDAVDGGFKVLAELPSVETVRVLGEMLFDERGYVKVPLEDTTESERYQSIKHSPVFHKAAGALDTLPIVAKPMDAPPYGYDCPEDTRPWRQWYQEIKDGKRTFRFEGDPTEYDLDGPAPRQKLERIALASRRDTERAHGRERAGTAADGVGRETEKTPGRLPAAVSIAAAALLFVSVAWYLARRQRGRVPRRGS